MRIISGKYKGLKLKGFDINGTFEKAEEAVRKIQAYDDTHDVVYNMSRLVMNSEGDLLALKAFSQFAWKIWYYFSRSTLW